MSTGRVVQLFDKCIAFSCEYLFPQKNVVNSNWIKFYSYIIIYFLLKFQAKDIARFIRNFKGRKLLSPKRRQSTTWRSKAWRKCSNIYFMPLLSSTPKERSHSTRPKLLSRSWAMDIAGGGRLMKTYRTGNESCIQNRMFSTAMETNGLLLESLNVGCSAILYWDNGTGQSHPTLPVSCPVLNRNTKV